MRMPACLSSTGRGKNGNHQVSFPFLSFLLSSLPFVSHHHTILIARHSTQPRDHSAAAAAAVAVVAVAGDERDNGTSAVDQGAADRAEAEAAQTHGVRTDPVVAVAVAVVVVLVVVVAAAAS